jgi:Ubiquitin carboxyl-terminal hydrolase
MLWYVILTCSAAISSLPNPGVHCFFNSSFQCLTGLHRFDEQVLNANGGPLVEALHRLKQEMRTNGYSQELGELVLPILQIVSLDAGENFADCLNHQDVAEFLVVLFNQLFEELYNPLDTNQVIDSLFESKALEIRHCSR